MSRQHGTRHGAAEAGSSPRRAPAPRYTPEQQELLEQGLRILARIAVRAYLKGRVSSHDTDAEPETSDAA